MTSQTFTYDPLDQIVAASDDRGVGVTRRTTSLGEVLDETLTLDTLTWTTAATDRRVVELYLTDEGNALLDTVFKENREWMKERMSGLTNEELEIISEAMIVLKKILE